MPKASAHFWWLPTALSIVLSTLGILALARHAFVTWSLSAPLELVMAAYNATMQLLFGWAHPYLQAGLTWLGSFMGWRPTLYPHWKDVFVVISLIGISAGRGYWRLDDRDYWRRGYPDTDLPNISVYGSILVSKAFVFSSIVGAFIAALAAGVVPLQSADLIAQLLIAASLGLGLLSSYVVQSVIDSNVDTLIDGLFVALLTSTFAAIEAWFFSWQWGYVAGLGLGVIASFVVMCALLNVMYGFRAKRSFPLQWGLTILGGFIGAAFVFAVDAGLKLLGA